MLGTAATIQRKSMSVSAEKVVKPCSSNQRAALAADFHKGLTQPDPVTVRQSFRLFMSKSEVRPTQFSADTPSRNPCYYGYSANVVLSAVRK